MIKDEVEDERSGLSACQMMPFYNVILKASVDLALALNDSFVGDDETEMKLKDVISELCGAWWLR